MTCKTCKFWLFIDSTIGETDDQSIWGICQRFPPTLPVEMNDFGINVHCQPVTDGVTWCGEYKEKSDDI